MYSVAGVPTVGVVPAVWVHLARRGLVTGDSHHELFPVDDLPVQALNGGVRLLLVHHLREPEPSRTPRLSVRDDPHVGRQAVRLEEHSKLVRAVVFGHVRDVELGGFVDGRRVCEFILPRRPRFRLEPDVDALPLDDRAAERLGRDGLLRRGELDEREPFTRQLALPVGDDVDLQHPAEGFEHLQHLFRRHRRRQVAHVQLRAVLIRSAAEAAAALETQAGARADDAGPAGSAAPRHRFINAELGEKVAVRVVQLSARARSVHQLHVLGVLRRGLGLDVVAEPVHRRVLLVLLGAEVQKVGPRVHPQRPVDLGEFLQLPLLVLVVVLVHGH